MMIYKSIGYYNKVTCPFCSKKTYGSLTARNTICCPWCGKTFRDEKYGIDIFPDEEAKPRFDKYTPKENS